MRQAKPAPDQPASGKDFLDLFRRSAGRHVKILGNFTEQKVTDAAAHEECLETGVLQVPNYLACVRAEFFQPNSVFGLCNDEIIINIVLRVVTG